MKICFWKRKIDPLKSGSSTRYYTNLPILILIIYGGYVNIQLNECDDIKPKG
ncbi:MAG: hypothetical protein IPJ51_19815 [Saprospiraceae bacterium]|nr:hypothetical protein [Saprospiraceae bacterium]MBP6239157.1 hypothetical protein [Saprospiraceae bacterium]